MLDVETAANLGNVVETLEDSDIRVVRLAHVAEHPRGLKTGSTHDLDRCLQ